MKALKGNDKGQMHTIEGLAAAIIMIMVLVLVVKSTAITPLTSSTTNKHVQLELMNMGQDLLTTLDYTGNPNDISSLKASVLGWNGHHEYVWDGEKYVNITDSDDVMDNDLIKALNFTFNPYGVAYNVEIQFINPDGSITTEKMIWNGDSSDNSISVSKVIAVNNYDLLAYPSFKDTGIQDFSQDTEYYNLVNIKLTLWRM